MTLTYIDCRPYIAEFLYNSFGCPVKFPRRSVENATLVSFTQTLPKGERPPTPGTYRVEKEGNAIVPIVVPESGWKPAARFYYLSPRGRAAVAETCENLFSRCLWSELFDLSDLGCTLMTAVYAWCELHGVSKEYAHTVRQRYYRMRKAYQNNNINIKFRHRHRDHPAATRLYELINKHH